MALLMQRACASYVAKRSAKLSHLFTLAPTLMRMHFLGIKYSFSTCSQSDTHPDTSSNATSSAPRHRPVSFPYNTCLHPESSFVSDISWPPPSAHAEAPWDGDLVSLAGASRSWGRAHTERKLRVNDGVTGNKHSQVPTRTLVGNRDFFSFYLLYLLYYIYYLL